MKKKYLIIFVLAFILGCSAVPYRTVLVPRWRVRLVNELGYPYSRQFVRLSAYDHTLNVEDGESKYVGDDGYIEFSEKSISMSLLERILFSGKGYFMVLAGRKVGTEIYLGSEAPTGYKRLKYAPSDVVPPPALFVLPLRKIIVSGR